MRGEKSDGVVAPVIRQVTSLQGWIIDELVDRHQFNGRDAKILQVFDDRRMSDPCVGAAQLFRHVRVQHGHAAYMCLVNDCLGIPVVRATVIAPVEGLVDDDGEHRVVDRVVVIRLRWVVEVVGKDRIGIVDLPFNCFRIRVEQEFGRVASMPLVWRVGTVDAVAIALSGPYAGQVGVPLVIIDLSEFNCGFVTILVKETQFNAVRDR